MSNTIDLKKLNSTDKINFVLEQQQKGLSRKEIAQLFNYSKISRLDDFMKRNNYIKVNDKFVLNDGGQMEDIERTTSSKASNLVNNKDIKTKEDNYPPTILQNEDIQSKLLNMISHYDDFVNMVKWFNGSGATIRQMEGNYPPIIEIQNGLQINYSKTEPIKTTVRVDKEIWDKFSNLCNEYNCYSKVDLLSQCMYEFIEKYSK